MGRRKTIRHRRKLRTYSLPGEFDCPFCNYNKCVEVFFRRRQGEGEIKCRVCNARYVTPLSPIMEKADLYCIWLDECHRVNQNITAVKNPGKQVISDSSENEDRDEAPEDYSNSKKPRKSYLSKMNEALSEKKVKKEGVKKEQRKAELSKRPFFEDDRSGSGGDDRDEDSFGFEVVIPPKRKNLKRIKDIVRDRKQGTSSESASRSHENQDWKLGRKNRKKEIFDYSEGSGREDASEQSDDLGETESEEEETEEASGTETEEAEKFKEEEEGAKEEEDEESEERSQDESEEESSSNETTSEDRRTDLVAKEEEEGYEDEDEDNDEDEDEYEETSEERDEDDSDYGFEQKFEKKFNKRFGNKKKHK